ncbi:aminoglycoside phosphotransferase [Streptomyces sp. p1417]|uniref:Aminoglycoside phosphotransferase n=1 Tax=Streptomyces typhae TaxID=2681492 RepID=A0A6L6WUF6_9ACTN|nr:aminoglycoside phosphotransferase [Streptomyces typhae]
MLSRPSFIDDTAIARTVAAHWLPAATEATHLPWGFGAYHWRVSDGTTTLFVTLDRPGRRHTGDSLEAAYAGAAALAAAGVDVVCAPLPTRSGRFTVDVKGGEGREDGAGSLSVTPWLEGRTPTQEQAGAPAHVRKVVAALAALHHAVPPAGLRAWAPLIGPGFAGELRERTARPWTSGPLAERARRALAARGDAIERWSSRYLELADVARSRHDTWVPTHGEPHHANQVLTSGGLKLVDWESLALAPRERDHPDLLAAGAGDLLRPDPAMIDLFALDWRLSEIAEYTDWFAGPHTGTADDHTALAELYEELEEPPDVLGQRQTPLR